ncbi:MAG: RNA-protein complex protein Nop10 [Candidatus Thermoplasmatota archaeon]|jgi:H/ACA ribonucleoprotein complex subunit 3|nr:RNA-protein complex protein Nop10 [Candidatus Thermoplasmatota archaeon]
MGKIKRCVKCGMYTLHDKCSLCGTPAISPAPSRFSPEDRYGKYRRMLYKKE